MAEGDVTSRFPVAVALVMKATNNLLRFFKSCCFADGNVDVLDLEDTASQAVSRDLDGKPG